MCRGMYLMLLGLKSCSQSLSAVHAALRGIKEKELKKTQISKPNRGMITLLSAVCDISRS